jgi:hypothetical protein
MTSRLLYFAVSARCAALNVAITNKVLLFLLCCAERSNKQTRSCSFYLNAQNVLVVRVRYLRRPIIIHIAVCGHTRDNNLGP